MDDEELIVDLLGDFFKELGYQVAIASSAEEAIEKLNNGQLFNLVLSDINLPGKSGIDLLKIIRETKNDLPVVLLTGLKTIDNAISAIKSGASDYITKPFELSAVKKVVERILKVQDRSLKKDQVLENIEHLKISLRFNTLELEPGILAKELADFLNKMHFAEIEEIKQYELVFTETLINAIEHGNLELSSLSKSNEALKLEEFESLKKERLRDLNYSRREIQVSFECSPEIFNFSVKDEGPGFMWQKYLSTNHKIQTVNVNSYGRGFNIIHHIIDEVHFNDKGNLITLIKNRPRIGIESK
ncbi:MAG: response regulator [Calditrichota bacterium]